MKQTVWLVYSPTGRAMTSTVSMKKRGAMRNCLDIAEQKYHGLVEQNFRKWEEKGYSVQRATILQEKTK